MKEGKQYPIYKDGFELFIWDVGGKVYNFGIAYEYIELKAGKVFLRINEILITEVE